MAVPDVVLAYLPFLIIDHHAKLLLALRLQLITELVLADLHHPIGISL